MPAETEVSHNHISPEKEKALEALEAPVITTKQEIKEEQEVQDSPKKVLILYLFQGNVQCFLFVK